MKKFSLKKSMAMVLALAMALALCVVPAFADTQYPAVAGTSTSFQKALIIDANANVPDVTFTYSIAPGTAQAAVPGTSVAVLAGVGTPSIANVVFAPGDATVTSASGVTIDAGEKAALKTATVDFSGVSFPEPGIYRYIVTETSAGQQGISYDTQAATAGVKTRVLDVYVVDNDGALEVANYVLHEGADSDTIGAGTNYGSNGEQDKSAGYVNEYQSYDLTVSKQVSGNQASRDKYFKFTVAITNAGANANIDVDFSNAATAPTQSAATIYTAAEMAAANGLDENAGSEAVLYTAEDQEVIDGVKNVGDVKVPASAGIAGQQWIADATGAVTKDIYLQHGQSVVFKGLGAGANITVTEVPEDYKSNQANNQVVVSNMAEDATAAFTNTKNGMVPTGVALSLLPGIALIGVGGGFAVAASRKKKEDEE